MRSADGVVHEGVDFSIDGGNAKGSIFLMNDPEEFVVTYDAPGAKESADGETVAGEASVVITIDSCTGQIKDGQFFITESGETYQSTLTGELSSLTSQIIESMSGPSSEPSYHEKEGERSCATAPS